MVGLALSALAKSNEQTMPLVIVAVMSQLVLSDGMIPVTDRLGPLGCPSRLADGPQNDEAS